MIPSLVIMSSNTSLPTTVFFVPDDAVLSLPPRDVDTDRTSTPLPVHSKRDWATNNFSTLPLMEAASRNLYNTVISTPGTKEVAVVSSSDWTTRSTFTITIDREGELLLPTTRDDYSCDVLRVDLNMLDDNQFIHVVHLFRGEELYYRSLHIENGPHCVARTALLIMALHSYVESITLDYFNEEVHLALAECEWFDTLCIGYVDGVQESFPLTAVTDLTIPYVDMGSLAKIAPNAIHVVFTDCDLIDTHPLPEDRVVDHFRDLECITLGPNGFLAAHNSGYTMTGIKRVVVPAGFEGDEEILFLLRHTRSTVVTHGVAYYADEVVLGKDHIASYEGVDYVSVTDLLPSRVSRVVLERVIRKGVVATLEVEVTYPKAD